MQKVFAHGQKVSKEGKKVCLMFSYEHIGHCVIYRTKLVIITFLKRPISFTFEELQNDNCVIF